jgi:hypothetical protein
LSGCCIMDYVPGIHDLYSTGVHSSTVVLYAWHFDGFQFWLP